MWAIGNLFVVSAKDEYQLAQLVDSYAKWLPTCQCSLGDLCFSAAVGKAHWPYRAAFVVDSLESLQRLLAHYSFAKDIVLSEYLVALSGVATKQNRKRVVSGPQLAPLVTDQQTSTARISELVRLAKLYVQGDELDWPSVVGSQVQGTAESPVSFVRLLQPETTKTSYSQRTTGSAEEPFKAADAAVSLDHSSLDDYLYELVWQRLGPAEQLCNLHATWPWPLMQVADLADSRVQEFGAPAVPGQAAPEAATSQDESPHTSTSDLVWLCLSAGPEPSVALRLGSAVVEPCASLEAFEKRVKQLQVPVAAETSATRFAGLVLLANAVTDGSAFDFVNWYEHFCQKAQMMFEAVRALALLDWPTDVPRPKVLLVTKSTSQLDSVGEPDPARVFSSSMLLGLVRVLWHEHPELCAVWLDTDQDHWPCSQQWPAGSSLSVLRRIIASLASYYYSYEIRDGIADAAACPQAECVNKAGIAQSPGDCALVPSGIFENQVSVRGEDVFGLRLDRSKCSQAPSPNSLAGTWIVAGGAGALGRQLVDQLIDVGAKSIVICGRRQQDQSISNYLDLLSRLAPRVVCQYVPCDLCNQAEVAELVKVAGSSPWPVVGVAHLAGVLRDGVVIEQNWEQFGAVFEPKVRGLWNLHQAVALLDIQHFITFSSTASALGSAGQTSYAMANGFVDGLAAWRRWHGLRSLNINWSAWTIGFGATIKQVHRQRLVDCGIGMLSPSEGRLVIKGLLGCQGSFVAQRYDWSKIANWISDSTKALTSNNLSFSCLQQADYPSAERRNSSSRIWQCLFCEAGRLLGRDLGPDDQHVALVDLGFDSLMSIEYRTGLSKALCVPVPATFVFDYPTFAEQYAWLEAALHPRQSVLDVSGKPAGALVTSSLQSDAILVKHSDDEASPSELTWLGSNQSGQEDIAVIGIGCHYPGGADGPDKFWDMMLSGQEAIEDIPVEHMDIAPLHQPDKPHVAHHAGLLHDVSGFDAQFFGISSREAAAMDPQQRYLLQTAWETFEHAGLAPGGLVGQPVGVYVGIATIDYYMLLRDRQLMDVWAASSNSLSMAAGRLSYQFGLKGPAMALDTACSSSLLAIHLACQSLRSGECSMALAGGVNLLLSPENFVHMSAMGVLSPTGHVRAFDSAADGYVRAEGCGLVLLKPLSQARRDGQRVLAVIKGSAANQDGRSNGITAPNGPSQTAVIRQAWRNAGISPSQIGLVEAHGVGTPLSDPMEVESLGRALLESSAADSALPVAQSRCLVGALKSQIGHSEAASGVAGFIKAVLAVRNGLVPGNCNYSEPTSLVDWRQWPLQVAQRTSPWPRLGRLRLAGVNAFGLSGTNVHVVVEQAPEDESASAPFWPYMLLPVSGFNLDCLRGNAEALRACAGSEPTAAGNADICYTASVGRQHLVGRGAFLGAAASFDDKVSWPSVQNFSDLLDTVKPGSGRSLAKGQGCFVGLGGTNHSRSLGWQVELASANQPRVAWLFTGQGSQFVGMGQELYQQWPRFRQQVDTCSELLEEPYRSKLAEVMFTGAQVDGCSLDDTVFSQLALFVYEYSLAVVWQELGVEPVALVGSSVGEYAAACVAGVFSLAQALWLLTARGELMQQLPPGGMLSLSCSALQANRMIISLGLVQRLSVASHLSAQGVVVAGDLAALNILEKHLAASSIAGQRLAVSGAFHSEHTKALLPRFAELLAQIDFHAPSIPLYSANGSGVINARVASADYWLEHMQMGANYPELVKSWLTNDATAMSGEMGFQDALASANCLLELGPQPQLLAILGLNFAEHQMTSPLLVATGRAAGSACQHFLTAVAELYTLGCHINWAHLYEGQHRRIVTLPSYRWCKQSYWFAQQDTPPVCWQVRWERLDRSSQLSNIGAASSKILLVHPKWGGAASDRLAGLLAEQCLDAGLEGTSISEVSQTLLQQASNLVVCCQTESGGCGQAAPELVHASCAGFLDLVQQCAREAQRREAAGERKGLKVWLVVAGMLPSCLEPLANDKDIATSSSRGSAGTGQSRSNVQKASQSQLPVEPSDPGSPQWWPLWSAARVAALEQPELGLKRVELPALVDTRSASYSSQLETAAGELVLALSGRQPWFAEDELSFRAGRWWASRLQAAEKVRPYLAAQGGSSQLASEGEDCAGKSNNRGWYYVTGGLGGLVLPLVEQLCQLGIRRFVLVSRRGIIDQKRQAVLDRLQSLGCEVVVESFDVADYAALSQSLQRARSRGGLRGIIHAAGVANLELVGAATTSQVDRVLAPKVDGAWYLHELTREDTLENFIMYSSVASILASPGQFTYAAANAFLDGLACLRARLGLPCLCLNWGAFIDGGMPLGDERRQEFVASTGMGLLHAKAGAEFLARLACSPRASLEQLGLADSLVYSPFSCDKWVSYYPQWLSSSLLKLLVASLKNTGANISQGSLAVSLQLQGLSDEQRLAVLLSQVRSQTAKCLGLADSEQVLPEVSFMDQGLDSLMSVELRNQLERQISVPLPVTVVFDYPCPSALAEHLAGKIFAELSSTRQEPHDFVVETCSAGPAGAEIDTEPIAIIGLGCRFPGGVNGPEAFWQLLVSGREAISEVPLERWDSQSWYCSQSGTPAKMVSRCGGFVGSAYEFDAAFFGISQREAAAMDPQQRVLLEVAWHTLENAGIAPKCLLGARCGVFLGLCSHDYGDIIEDLAKLDAWSGTGLQVSAACGRLSYMLGLEGPSLVVDTACSSSLASVHLACQSLRKGECQLALAGGVNLVLSPAGSVLHSLTHTMSPSGHCRSFDAQADGFVRSDGCGLVMLKPLSQALRDGNQVYAVISGSAMNQDGRSNGLTAPSSLAQQKVIRQALQAAKLQPGDIAFVEAHGSATQLGDPIELGALGETLGQGRCKDQPLWVGTVKSQLGHCEGAAGVAGLIKAVLSVQRGIIPPNMHFVQPSEHIDWERWHLAVPTTAQPWPDQQPRRAGVSAFGISGTNVHMIVEEYRDQSAVAVPVPTGSCLLSVSAKDAPALAELVSRWCAYLQGEYPQSLEEICVAAAVGREHYSCRAAFLADSKPIMAKKMQMWLKAGTVACHTKLTEVAFFFSNADVAHDWPELEDWPVFVDNMRQLEQSGQEYGLQELDSQTKLDWQLLSRQYAVAQLLYSWGMPCQSVAGQGLGIVGAALLAEVIDISEAVALTNVWRAPEEQYQQVCQKLRLSRPSAVRWDNKWLERKNWQHLVRSGVSVASLPADCAYVFDLEGGFLVSVEAKAWPGGYLGVDIDSLDSAEKSPSSFRKRLMETVAALYCLGAEVAWPESKTGVRVEYGALPSYPFRRDYLRVPFSYARAADSVLSDSNALSSTSDNSWLYNLKWRKLGNVEAVSAQKYLVVGCDQVELQHIAQALEHCGCQAVVMLSQGSKLGLAKIIESRLVGQEPWAGVIYGALAWYDNLVGEYRAQSSDYEPAKDVSSLAARYVQPRLEQVTEIVKGILAAGLANPPQLVVITAGAYSLHGELPEPGAGALWGWLRTAALEFPELRVGGLDYTLAAAKRRDDYDLLGQALAFIDQRGERQCAVRQGAIFGARLRRAAAGSLGSWQASPSKTYVVSGGLGALGLECARVLVDCGAASLVLISRHPQPVEQLTEWEHKGVRVYTLACDVGDYASLSRSLQVSSSGCQLSGLVGCSCNNYHPSSQNISLPCLGGVIHTAGVLDDGIISEQNGTRIARVMQPKFTGAWNLHRLTRQASLDLFVLYSSSAAYMGSAGQSNYAAANAALLSLASWRACLGMPVLCLSWGAWNVGMGSKLNATYLSRLQEEGISLIQAQWGSQRLRQLLDSRGQYLVIPVDWQAAVAKAPEGVPSLYGELLPSSAAVVVSGADSLEQPGSLDSSSVAALVVQELGKALGIREQLDWQRPLVEYGLDSLMALELRNVLSKRSRLSLPVTLAFDYPTVQALVDYLKEALGMPAEGQRPDQVTPVQDQPDLIASGGESVSRGAQMTSDSLHSPLRYSDAKEIPSAAAPVAVIGLGCHFPGQVGDADSLWQLLSTGADAVTEVPKERWDAQAYYDPEPGVSGKACSRWGGFIAGAEDFDAAFFGIPPYAAAKLDPQQSLLLQTAWEAMENAGCTAGRGGGETGVFVGLTEQDYKHNKLCSVEDLDLSAVSGSSGAQASGRLAYHLGLHGPCLTIDTACSSSLAAVHLAVNSLRLGECQMALAGGVTLQYSPAVNIASNQTKTLSAEGRCKPFADDADGIVWSDGCAVVVLKLYDQAVRDRDNIMAVIAGSAINQDGRANGLSSPTAQEVMQRALRLSGLKANDLGYVEAFGSGIRMADAIEAQAIGALAGGSRPSKPTYVGSIKSNFGHCMAASGVASLAKVVLSLQHQAVPVNLHCLEANSLVEWDKLGLKVATQKLSWPASDKLRVAAVNSFGNSGTNVSVVLCDRPGSAGAVSGVEAPEAVVVGLSARSRQALRSAAQRLGDYCQVAEDLSVSDVSFTSLAGRRVFEHRLAVVCSSQKELVEALQAYLSGTDSAACFTAVVQRQDQLVAEPMGWSAVQVVGYYLSAPAQAVESWTAKCPYGRIVPLPGQLNN